jgi:hypothetical protein
MQDYNLIFKLLTMWMIMVLVFKNVNFVILAIKRSNFYVINLNEEIYVIDIIRKRR